MNEFTPGYQEDEITIRKFSARAHFLQVAELLDSEGMFNQERDTWSQLQLPDNENRIRVAIAAGGRVVGSVYINGGIGLVEGLVVHPDFRGQGIGPRLLDAAEQKLREDGHQNMELQIDVGQDGLEAWYRANGFEVNYKVVGLIRPITPLEGVPKVAEAADVSETSVDYLERNVVHGAFMNIYWRYRSRFGYYELPHLDIPKSYATFLEKSDGLWDIPRVRSDRLKIGGESPVVCGAIIPTPFAGTMDELLRSSSIPALQAGGFYDGYWRTSSTTPWVEVPSDEDEQAAEHLQCWMGRYREMLEPLQYRSVQIEQNCAPELFFQTLPNDALLFLRQLKGVKRFGRPVPLKAIEPEGDYVCYDRANNNMFAFRITGQHTELLRPEETATIFEDLVRCAEIYAAQVKDYETDLKKRWGQFESG